MDTMNVIQEHLAIIILFLFMYFVLIVFIAYRWFGVDALIDELEAKEANEDALMNQIEDLAKTLSDSIDDCKSLKNNITHNCVVDENNNINFLVRFDKEGSIDECLTHILSLMRHELHGEKKWSIKPATLHDKIELGDVELLVRRQAMKEAGLN